MIWFSLKPRQSITNLEYALCDDNLTKQSAINWKELLDVGLDAGSSKFGDRGLLIFLGKKNIDSVCLLLANFWVYRHMLVWSGQWVCAPWVCDPWFCGPWLSRYWFCGPLVCGFWVCKLWVWGPFFIKELNYNSF